MPEMPQKYELVTDSIDSSLAALIHPNSTMMRRCFVIVIATVIVNFTVIVHIILVVTQPRLIHPCSPKLNHKEEVL